MLIRVAYDRNDEYDKILDTDDGAVELIKRHELRNLVLSEMISIDNVFCMESDIYGTKPYFYNYMKISMLDGKVEYTLLLPSLEAVDVDDKRVLFRRYDIGKTVLEVNDFIIEWSERTTSGAIGYIELFDGKIIVHYLLCNERKKNWLDCIFDSTKLIGVLHDMEGRYNYDELPQNAFVSKYAVLARRS